MIKARYLPHAQVADRAIPGHGLGDLILGSTASAMIDRIVHHADVIALKGASYRIKHTPIDTLPSVEVDRQADSTP